MIKSGKKNNRIIYILLLIVVLKGTLWAIMVPRWLVPDEPFYFEYTRLILATGKIPSVAQTPAAGHPALYPILAVVPYLLGKPFGENTQLLFIRLMGVMFEILIIFLTYKATEIIFPKNKYLPITVSALLAFNPQFSFIMASANSDTLLILATAIWYYAFSLYVMKNERLTIYQALSFIAIAIFGLLTKQRFEVALTLVSVVVVLEVFRRSRPSAPKIRHQTLERRRQLTHSLIILPAISLPFSWELFTRNDLPSRMFTGFWGNFGWFQYLPLRQSTYNLLWWITVICLIGLTVSIADRLRLYFFSSPEGEARSALKLNQLVILISFAAVAFLAYYTTAVYDYKTHGANARYLFVAIFPAYLLLTEGLKRLIPTFLEKNLILILIVSALLLNLHSLFFIISPFYYGVTK